MPAAAMFQRCFRFISDAAQQARAHYAAATLMIFAMLLPHAPLDAMFSRRFRQADG